MTNRITLRAKSDGTEISGELLHDGKGYWEVRLAPGTAMNVFNRASWDRVPGPLPTTPGTVFRATVREVPNVRVMMTDRSDDVPYTTATYVGLRRWFGDEEIDASTVVIELNGVDA